jgi:hypothetical protein
VVCEWSVCVCVCVGVLFVVCFTSFFNAISGMCEDIAHDYRKFYLENLLPLGISRLFGNAFLLKKIIITHFGS